MVEVLRVITSDRERGPVFRRRGCSDGSPPSLSGLPLAELERAAALRVIDFERVSGADMSRREKQKTARTVWRDAGAVREDWVRIEFMRVTASIGLAHITAPKTFRHTFATTLQDANVDPLIRNEVMGHSPVRAAAASSLGTTGLYTHTRPETKRRQLEAAMINRPAVTCARDWLSERSDQLRRSRDREDFV